jgi:hypothetical protein
MYTYIYNFRVISNHLMKLEISSHHYIFSTFFIKPNSFYSPYYLWFKKCLATHKIHVIPYAVFEQGSLIFLHDLYCSQNTMKVIK